MDSDQSVQTLGPQGHDPTVRKTIPIKREQISQTELVTLLEAATRVPKYSYTSFAWRDGTTNLVTDRLLRPEADEEANAARKVRDFHQLEELAGVITHTTFEDESTLWLTVGDFSDTQPSVKSAADKQPSVAQQRVYEIRTLVDSFEGAQRFPGTRKFNKFAFALEIAIVILLITVALLISRQAFDWLSVVPIVLTWLVTYIFGSHLLFRPPLRPFVAGHAAKSKVEKHQLPDWLQVFLAVISLAVAAWTLYLTY